MKKSLVAFFALAVISNGYSTAGFAQQSQDAQSSSSHGIFGSLVGGYVAYKSTQFLVKQYQNRPRVECKKNNVYYSGPECSSATVANEQTSIVGNKTPSQVLADNMEATGEGPLPRRCAAHHIVPRTDSRGAAARLILRQCGIDINDAVNGVYLPVSSQAAINADGQTGCKGIAHSRVHTNYYYGAIVGDTEDALGMDKARETTVDWQQTPAPNAQCATVRNTLRFYKLHLTIGDLKVNQEK